MASRATPSPATQVQVVVRSATDERSYAFPIGAQVVAGRHTTCQLRLESDTVSRQHVVLEFGEEALSVEDISTNGTLAGDTLLLRQSTLVPYGTPVALGEFVLVVRPIVARASEAPREHVPRMESVAARPGEIGPWSGGVSVATVASPMKGNPPPFVGQHHAPSAMPMMHGSPRIIDEPGAIEAERSAMARSGEGRALSNSGSNPALRPGTGSVSVARPAEPRGRHVTAEMRERRKKDIELRRKIHKALLEHLDLATVDPSKLDDPSMRPKVLGALRRIVGQLEAVIPPEVERDQLIGELADEALGLGPLERFLSDPSISEIMVVDPETIYVERGGKLVLSDGRFTDDDRVRAVIERIVTPLGRRIDESSPIVDARLKDGSRVNAVIRPLALRGSCITIRKFARTPLTLERLIEFGTLTPPMARFLTRSVIAKRNIVISGGTGSGKTTLLNVLSGAIPEEERIVTIEDAAELQLKQPHVVSLETRPPNMEGRGEYTIRDLVKNALRMRPDRIVVGECRGGEALDMLQAMNTGHDGSLTTTHANTPQEAVGRLETLSLMSGLDLPSRAIREQISSSIHLIVQQSRLSDGTRKITAISEVIGLNDDGEVELRPIFEFVRTGTGEGGKVVGEFRPTGYLPSYLQAFIVLGLVARGESYL